MRKKKKYRKDVLEIKVEIISLMGYAVCVCVLSNIAHCKITFHYSCRFETPAPCKSGLKLLLR